jgi:starch-binding outer membrane protein, SusD/RagB family
MHHSNSTLRRYTSRALLACALPALALSACNKLLDVNVPGAVSSTALDSPDLMASLVTAARGQVECAVGSYIAGEGFLTNEFWSSSSFRNFNVWDAHLLEIKTQTGPCPTATGTSTPGFYVALAGARFQTDDAYRRISAFSADQLSFNKTQALGTLAALAGYSYTLLGEGFCQMAIDGGAMMTRAQVFAKALDKFTDAETLATQASDATTLNLAHVGKARILLNLGRKPEAAAAAKLVPQGFPFNATNSTSNALRNNRVYLNNYANQFITIAPEYINLTVNGVPDARVVIQNANRLGQDSKTPLYYQTKYTLANSPIPIASWREAQLIIAEAELGQSAVDHINVLRDFYKLPRYAPADVNDAQAVLKQVIEERRRELFLEGQRLNDMLRFNIPFPTGPNHLGEPYGPTTCAPLPDAEYDGNPNISR